MTVVDSRCVVCGTVSDEPVFRHDGPTSITSTAASIAAPTVVHVCRSCAHIQTAPLPDIGQYYDTSYNVRLESDDADDLYAVTEHGPVYRCDHQARTALAKLDLRPGAAVLDYGCGKGMSLRAMLRARPDLNGWLFDVSDSYRAVWSTFTPVENQASHRIPATWRNGVFDAVLSFFALEHVADPAAFLREIRCLLRPHGTVHLTVPNIQRNIGDFIVVDHVNHFMPTSLRRAFSDAGFVDIVIDEEAHDAAFVINAKRDDAIAPAEFDAAQVARSAAAAHAYATFWSAAGAQLRDFESTVAAGRRSAIYGSGFYGVFIASRVSEQDGLKYFLDRNPHQQAKRIFGLPVLPPDGIGDDIDVVYVGLNPNKARRIVDGVESIHRRPRDLFFFTEP